MFTLNDKLQLLKTASTALSRRLFSLAPESIERLQQGGILTPQKFLSKLQGLNRYLAKRYDVPTITSKSQIEKVTGSEGDLGRLKKVFRDRGATYYNTDNAEHPATRSFIYLPTDKLTHSKVPWINALDREITFNHELGERFAGMTKVDPTGVYLYNGVHFRPSVLLNELALQSEARKYGINKVPLVDNLLTANSRAYYDEFRPLRYLLKKNPGAFTPGNRQSIFNVPATEARARKIDQLFNRDYLDYITRKVRD